MGAEPIEPWWKITMRAQPWVCHRCSRRFPRLPFKGRCPDHVAAVAVTDQHDLIATWGPAPEPDPWGRPRP